MTDGPKTDPTPEELRRADEVLQQAMRSIDTATAKVAHEHGPGPAIGGAVSGLASALAFMVYQSKPGRFAGEPDWVEFRCKMVERVMDVVQAVMAEEQMAGVEIYIPADAQEN